MRRMEPIVLRQTGQLSQRSRHRTHATVWPHGTIAAFTSLFMHIAQCCDCGGKGCRERGVWVRGINCVFRPLHGRRDGPRGRGDVRTGESHLRWASASLAGGCVAGSAAAADGAASSSELHTEHAMVESEAAAEEDEAPEDGEVAVSAVGAPKCASCLGANCAPGREPGVGW